MKKQPFKRYVVLNRIVENPVRRILNRDPKRKKTPAQIRMEIDRALDLFGGRLGRVKLCRFCESELEISHATIHRYDHDGGFFVHDTLSRQWLYVTCPGCGYQWSLTKLLKRG